MRQRKSLELYPLTMCYFIKRTQKCTKLFFKHYYIMKKKRIITLSVALFLCAIAAFAGPRLVKVKLTGTIYEDIEMTVGRSGRKEVISHLPYVFQVAKEDLPIELTFRSEHYSYISIDVPKKPVDDIGHVYLVKKQETTYMQPISHIQPVIQIR